MLPVSNDGAYSLSITLSLATVVNILSAIKVMTLISMTGAAELWFLAPAQETGGSRQTLAAQTLELSICQFSVDCKPCLCLQVRLYRSVGAERYDHIRLLREPESNDRPFVLL